MDELAGVEKISDDSGEDPFQVLIATMLSAQTKDAVTHAASTRLFRVARTPATMATLSEARLRRLIYPVSFYRVKAHHVRRPAGRFWRASRGGAGHHGRSPHVAGGRTQDGEPGAHSFARAATTSAYADACNIFGGEPADIEHKLAVLRGHCDRLGTDYDAIEKTMIVSGDPTEDPDGFVASMEPFAALGISMITMMPAGDDPVAWTTTVCERVVPKLAEL